MTKRRTPDTIEDALVQAVAYVGIADVAGMVGRTADMVRKFGDPNNDHHLQLRQALEIDRQLALRGYPQPFAALMATLAAKNAQSTQQLAHDLVERRPMAEAAAAVCAASRLVEAIDRAETDQVYDACEVDALRKQIRALSARLPALERAILSKGGVSKGRRR